MDFISSARVLTSRKPTKRQRHPTPRAVSRSNRVVGTVVIHSVSKYSAVVGFLVWWRSLGQVHVVQVLSVNASNAFPDRCPFDMQVTVTCIHPQHLYLDQTCQCRRVLARQSGNYRYVLIGDSRIEKIAQEDENSREINYRRRVKTCRHRKLVTTIDPIRHGKVNSPRRLLIRLEAGQKL